MKSPILSKEEEEATLAQAELVYPNNEWAQSVFMFCSKLSILLNLEPSQFEKIGKEYCEEIGGSKKLSDALIGVVIHGLETV